MRLCFGLLALVLSFPPGSHAQELCDGFATDPVDGTLYPCENAALLGRLPLADMGVPTNPSSGLPYRGNDIWGWTDPQDGREYALVGNKSGTYFVDVTDPADLRPLGSLPTETTETTWRDIKVYANHAFVVADGAGDHGMQVLDLTRLRGLAPDDSRLFTTDAVYTGIGSAHNVAINEATGFAYVVGAAACSGGLHMVDLQDPTNPTFAGCFSEDGYTHDAHCITYAGPDTDYTGREICAASNEDTITLVDVTDKGSPVLITRVFYPNTGYAHQGWFSPDHRYFYADDETDEIQGLVANTRTLQFDFADLDAPALKREFFHDTQATDHNLYMRGEIIHLSNNASGLRFLQVLSTDPDAMMTPFGYFDTYPEHDDAGFEGAWSVFPFFGVVAPLAKAIVSDRSRGLFVLNVPSSIPTASEPDPIPDGIALGAAVPTPFSSHTRLTLTLAEPQHIQAALYDALGRRLTTLLSREVAAGETVIDIDGTRLAPGTYFVRVKAASFRAIRALVRTR